MADIRDEFGNPIKLTDESGNPVQLTDERGNPVHIKGVATVVGDGGGHGTLKDMFKKDETVAAASHHRPVEKIGRREPRVGKIGRDSDSSSSEDDGMGGRRKKGVKDKLKEKLNLGQDHAPAVTNPTGKMPSNYPAVTNPMLPTFPAGVTPVPATTHPAGVTPVPAAKVTTHAAGVTPVPAATHAAGVAPVPVTTNPAEPVHEKKSMLEKIKEKLPGHHGHGH